MLLILTTKYEKYTNQVEEALDLIGMRYYRLNLDVENIKATFVSFFSNDIEIIQNDRKILLSDFSMVWVKRKTLHTNDKEEKEFAGFSDEANFKIWRNEWNSILGQIVCFLELNNVIWFDMLDSLNKAEKKNVQIKIAKTIDFNVPKTFISNDKQSILAFLKKNNESVLKLATQPAIYKEDDIYFIFTNKITKEDLQDFDSCINSPMIFQEYIEKQYEVRYTFINGKHFVCKIDSQVSEISKIDWRRYDIKNTPYIEIEPPKEIFDKVNQFMRCLQLNYGALDFIVDKENKWWFLEINPVGQYGWIEQLTGMPITQAIVDYIKQKLPQQTTDIKQ